MRVSSHVISYTERHISEVEQHVEMSTEIALTDSHIKEMYADLVYIVPSRTVHLQNFTHLVHQYERHDVVRHLPTWVGNSCSQLRT